MPARQQTASAQLGTLLLRGHTMLAESCPSCNVRFGNRCCCGLWRAGWYAPEPFCWALGYAGSTHEGPSNAAEPVCGLPALLLPS